MSDVHVRYWAAAREAAGIETEQVECGVLSEVLAEMRSRHDDRFSQVLSVSSLLVDGRAVGGLDPDAVRLAAGETLEVLPPFAGG